MSSEVQCSRCLILYVYIDRQSHPLTRPSTQIQFTLNAPPQPHNATQHKSMFLSGDCQAAHFTYPSVQVGRRNSANLRHPTPNSRTSTLPVWLNAHTASALLCLLFPKNHSHCSMPFTVMQRPFVASQAIVSREPSNLLRREWADWCGAISSWCVIGCAWAARSDKSRNGDYTTGLLIIINNLNTVL